MKRLFCLGLFLLAASATQAQGPGCKVVWIDQTVTCQKMEWRSRDVTCEVAKPVYREEVRVVRRDVVVPEWKEETREVESYALKPRQVVHEVCKMVMVPVTVVDPCTGCPYTVCKQHMTVEKVSCTVYDAVTVMKKVPVRVCTYKTEPREFKETLVHREWKTEKVTTKEYYCVPVTYTTTTKVPVLVPDCP